MGNKETFFCFVFHSLSFVQPLNVFDEFLGLNNNESRVECS